VGYSILFGVGIVIYIYIYSSIYIYIIWSVIYIYIYDRPNYFTAKYFVTLIYIHTYIYESYVLIELMNSIFLLILEIISDLTFLYTKPINNFGIC